MSKKVLLADDEEDILMLVSATLGGDDRYSLILARDGEEALARCEWLCHACRSQDEARLRDVRDGFFESVTGNHEDTTRLS